MSVEELDDNDMEERRGIERRVQEMEKTISKLVTAQAVTESKLEGMIQTMDSRHKSFERGQDLILERLRPLQILADQKLHDRVLELENVKAQMSGALRLIAVLGVLGIVSGIIGLVKMIKGS